MTTTPDTETLTPEREAAWIGILQAHGQVTRALEAELASRHDLSLSSYEVLSRLARAEHSSQRMSDLASCSPLSLSRVSRVIDGLQKRGLVARSSCSTDSRVVYAAVTDAGQRLADEASDTFAQVVQGRYLARLNCGEIEQLSSLLARLVDCPE